MGDLYDKPLWDGNGGELDPRKATQRDLLVALHVKVDGLIKVVDGHTSRISALDQGEFTRGQTAEILNIVQGRADRQLNRRSMKAPIWAAAISLAALFAMIALTLTYGGIS